MSTVTVITLVTLVFAGLLVGRGIRVARTYRQRGDPFPWYYAGNVAGGIGTMCLLAGTLVRDSPLLQWTLLTAALICLGVDVVQYRRARRQV